MKSRLKCSILILIFLMLLSGFSCVHAEDLNATDEVLSSDSNELEELEAANSENDNATILASESQSNTNSKAYLVLDNDADLENIHVGDYVTWIVSVLNRGPDTAKNVKVFDELPDGLKYVTHTTTKGVFNPKTGIWNIGDLAVSDGEVFLNITTQAFSVGEKINKAILTTDSINLNNESYEEEEIDVLEYEVVEKSIDSRYATGNPIALIFMSLFAIFISVRYR